MFLSGDFDAARYENDLWEKMYSGEKWNNFFADKKFEKNYRLFKSIEKETEMVVDKRNKLLNKKEILKEELEKAQKELENTKNRTYKLKEQYLNYARDEAVLKLLADVKSSQGVGIGHWVNHSGYYIFGNDHLKKIKKYCADTTDPKAINEAYQKVKREDQASIMQAFGNE